MKNDGARAQFGRLPDGFLTRLAGGIADRGPRVGKFVTVGIGPENARRHRAEIMQRTDLDDIFFPGFQDSRPKGNPDRVTQLDRGKSELPDLLEHVVAILVAVRIPAGG